MPPQYFPLRWESTRDQWWYVSPIDWAAANGYYNLVRELLHLDTNQLIKLTSLRRIRRLETVWDDEKEFQDVAKLRARVAHQLLHDCATKRGNNSLIRAGYGGWLLYTAASAGDLVFINELLEKNPLLVFGEGEYGVTDILYAASRSKNCHVFRLLFDFCVSPRSFHCFSGESLDDQSGEILATFKWEMMNRAAHAAARGGSVEILKELIGVCSDTIGYRDVQGSTILHTATGRGQAEVVKYLLSSYDMTDSVDNLGNTALHVAAYRGYLAALEAIVIASPSSIALCNNNGDTFLHMAVSGFQTPGFRRLDRQIELMKQLIYGKIVDLKEIINVMNKDGRTPLHMAVVEIIQFELVELLMSVSSIDLNIRDTDGFTPLDLLKKRRKSVCCDILITRLISAGGVSNGQDRVARSAIVSRMKMLGIGCSPGTSFRIPDSEILLYTGIEDTDPGWALAGAKFSGDTSDDIDRFETDSAYNSWNNNKHISVNQAARHFKLFLGLARRKERKIDTTKSGYDDGDNESLESYNVVRNQKNTPVPLRYRYSKQTNIKTLQTSNSLPSSLIKSKFTAGLLHGVIRTIPRFTNPNGSPSSSNISKPSSVVSSPTTTTQPQLNSKMTSLNKRVMNQYLCFGAEGVAFDDSMCSTRTNQTRKHPGFFTA